MIKSKKSRKSILIACIIFALIISIMGTALAATSLVIPGYSNGPGQVTLAVPTMWDGQGVFFIVSKNSANQQFDIELCGDRGYRDQY